MEDVLVRVVLFGRTKLGRKNGEKSRNLGRMEGSHVTGYLWRPLSDGWTIGGEGGWISGPEGEVVLRFERRKIRWRWRAHAGMYARGCALVRANALLRVYLDTLHEIKGFMWCQVREILIVAGMALLQR